MFPELKQQTASCRIATYTVADLPTLKTSKSGDFEKKSQEKPGDWDLKLGDFQKMR